jgi:hypothetical protein
MEQRCDEACRATAEMSAARDSLQIAMNAQVGSSGGSVEAIEWDIYGTNTSTIEVLG